MQPLPTPQGITSPTFKGPPTDGTLLLPEIFDHHAQHSPAHTLFRFVDADGGLQAIPWLDAVHAFHKAARLVKRLVEPADLEARPVIGIVAATDQITYFTLIAGILRAGYQVFPVSPRNSDAAIAHLLQSTGCNYVFVSADSAMQKLAGAAATKIVALGGQINLIPVPSFVELYDKSTTGDFLPPMRKLDLEAPAVILHSSGSTAFPKIITFTYRILMESGLIPYHGEIDVCGQVLSVHAVPMFHLMGVIQLPWTTFSGLTIAVFPPTLPPTVPTPDRVFESAVASGSSLMFCVPAFLEAWARDDSRLPALQKFKTVTFAGGPLQQPVGDLLVQNNVNIAHVYGLTETSNLTLFLPKAPPKEGWDYFYLSPHTDLVFVPLSDMPGVYHLVAKKCPTHTPAVLDTVVDAMIYFSCHPTNPNLWKVFGRLDDQIMHSTGEKTNPVPLEAILLKDARIKFAIMFGRGKFHAGPEWLDFRRQIWPTVEESNRFAPTHSRIFKEMILIAKPSKTVELTAKGTPRRQAVLAMYEDEIQDIYLAVKETSQTHLTTPEKYDALTSLKFVRSVVAEVMREMPSDDDDLFQHGCDSLQATWIRNSILHALRSSRQIDTRTIPHNFVYSYPTLRLLAEYITEIASGLGLEPEDISLRTVAMESMVQKYTCEFPRSISTTKVPEAETVLITGTTGALGSQILAHLLALPNITSVYALNRPRSNIREYQRSSFADSGIEIQLIDSPKLILLEGDLNTTEFGISSSEYRDIRDKVTCIIHNAWQVNFNISLSSMEPLVAGTRQLVDFALSSPHQVPPRLLFVSTAGIFRNLNASGVVPEDHLATPETSVGQGYAESKWVAEKVLEIAAQQTNLSLVIVRPTQLTGSENGAWKLDEWFPALLRCSQLLGRLPAISGRVSWIPIHHAGKAIVEMRNSTDRYLHLTHPHPVPMSEILGPISDALHLPVVPYSEWLKMLEDAQESDAETSNPGIPLIEFFRSNREASADQEAFFPGTLSSTHALTAASSLVSIPSLSARDAQTWVSYLHQAGYLSH
ncbi:hypothetical protein C8J57DRAFT_1368382 [Mycena rebaudengoi]|nr:hypothetical protein C8J57DRAFT_1368382 [Mycena rebaudengoi]